MGDGDPRKLQAASSLGGAETAVQVASPHNQCASPQVAPAVFRCWL